MTVCAKGQRHCPEYLSLQESAYKEWSKAETLSAVRAAWGRFGGCVTLHRHGREHFAELARRRLGVAESS